MRARNPKPMPGDLDYNAYWRKSQRNVDRIENLQSLLKRAHKERNQALKDRTLLEKAVALLTEDLPAPH